MTYLRSVTLRPSGPATMGRKAAGREVAAVVHACPACGWESRVCRTLAEARRVPRHVCQTRIHNEYGGGR